jgi:hypothetical protein
MIGNVDLDLLEKTYMNAATGITALKAVLGKPENHALNTELYKHLKNYQDLADKSKMQLMANGTKVKEPSLYGKAMMKSSVKMNTLMDPSDSRIAQMVIEGSTMGLTQITRLLNSNKNAEGTSVEIAKEFILKEEENIEAMKKFL